MSSGTKTPSSVTSFHWCTPCISRIGRVERPGELRSTMSWLSPAWRSSPSGSVRHRTTKKSAACAPPVHFLTPCTSQPPSVRSARVFTAARSEPAPSSLMPIANEHSPHAIAGSSARRCASVPKRSSAGPVCRSATQCALTGAPAASSSSVTTQRSGGLRPPPPYSRGHVMPTQPRAASARENSGDAPHADPHASHCTSNGCSARNARTSARSSAAPSGARAGGSASAVSAPEVTPARYPSVAMAWLDRDGVRIHYEVHGTASARDPVLLSHGFCASAAMWQPNLAAFGAQRAVVAWDLRGHARSDAPDDPALYAHHLALDDMSALLDAAGAARAVLCGMSLGGYLSLRFHALFPERVAALILVDTGPGYRRDSERDGWNAYCDEVAADLEARGLAAVRDSPEVAEHPSARGLAHAARGIMGQRDALVAESLGTVVEPTLVVVGSEDAPFLRAADYMAAKIPGARKVVIDGAGHAANMDRPEVFNAAVTDFLEAL